MLKRHEVFTAEEQELIISAIKAQNNHQFTTFILLMQCSAMRVGEAIAVSWKNIDLDAKTAVVSEKKVRQPVKKPCGCDGDFEECVEPIRSGLRTVPLSDEAILALTILSESQPQKTERVFGDTKTQTFLSMWKRTINDLIAKGSLKADKSYNLHTWRHTAILNNSHLK